MSMTAAKRFLPRPVVPHEQTDYTRREQNQIRHDRQHDNGPPLSKDARAELVEYVARCLRHGAWEVAALACENAREPVRLRLTDEELKRECGHRLPKGAAECVSLMVDAHLDTPNVHSAAQAIRERLRRREFILEHVAATDEIDKLALEDSVMRCIRKRRIETVQQLIDAIEALVSPDTITRGYVVSPAVDAELCGVLEAHELLGPRMSAWLAKCRHSATRQNLDNLEARRAAVNRWPSRKAKREKRKGL